MWRAARPHPPGIHTRGPTHLLGAAQSAHLLQHLPQPLPLLLLAPFRGLGIRGLRGRPASVPPPPRGPPLPGATDVPSQAREPLSCASERPVVRAGQVGGRRPAASGQHGWQLGPGEYLGAVLSHGVVVEAGLGLELLPAMLTLQCILQLQTGMLVRGRSWGASPPEPRGSPTF